MPAKAMEKITLSDTNREVIRLERESVIPILKPRLIVHLANLIGTLPSLISLSHGFYFVFYRFFSFLLPSPPILGSLSQFHQSPFSFETKFGFYAIPTFSPL